jgi:hypothetical protein
MTSRTVASASSIERPCIPQYWPVDNCSSSMSEQFIFGVLG